MYGYNVYEFITDKENNLNLEKAYKFTKVPVTFINYYAINEKISNIEYKLNSLNEYHEKINDFLRFELFSEREFKNKFHALDFHTKYNVNPDIDTYKQWDLFRKLNKFYMENNKDKYYLTKKD